MMIEPPIDALIKIAALPQDTDGGCKFTLCACVSRRARYLRENMPQVLEDAHKKAISYAADELFDGSVRPIVG